MILGVVSAAVVFYDDDDDDDDDGEAMQYNTTQYNAIQCYYLFNIQ